MVFPMHICSCFRCVRIWNVVTDIVFCFIISIFFYWVSVLIFEIMIFFYEDPKDYISVILRTFKRRKTDSWTNCNFNNNIGWKEMLLVINWIL